MGHVDADAPLGSRKTYCRYGDRERVRHLERTDDRGGRISFDLEITRSRYDNGPTRINSGRH